MPEEKYLDTKKSMIISSPAGSGKTERLARRYISLLKSGSDVRKILAITFTEKAAAEMKERIVNTIQKEDPELYESIKNDIPFMRISTIHSFCLKLLKRFSVELGFDPSFEIADETLSHTLWSEAVYEILEEEKKNPSTLFRLMKEHSLRGHKAIMEVLKELFQYRPRPELMILKNHNAERTKEREIFEIFRSCLDRYDQKKRKLHLYDFSDLEINAYRALSKIDSWQSILYAFDEQTDHLLVDEFQDTSTLQWMIIDKLTEEWRAGLGAKRDSGKTPTIFFVGDEKQSIYNFRGANVSVFNYAKNKLSEWLGDDYIFEEIKENYRSLPAIIDFTNALFSKIMQSDGTESWRTNYSPFYPKREGDGKVELVILENPNSSDRTKEAYILAKMINSIVGNYEIYDNGKKRPCEFKDIAILLERKTSLGVYENALRKESIPFIVQKGLGFFTEPEVAILRDLVSFLVDPLDDWSLFNILRSPLFMLDYKTLSRLLSKKPLIDSLNKKGTSEIYLKILGWLERQKSTPLSILLEEILSETKGWSHFWEKQRHANIKKFLSIVGGFEAEGLSPMEIREKLIRHSLHGDMSKANINTAEMNAVSIMTIHSAKGLEFPVVFLPGLDGKNQASLKSVAIDDEPEKIQFSYEQKPKEEHEIHCRCKEKELEEGKRLFYVAVTRAKDYLCMLGYKVKNEYTPKSRLEYIDKAFQLNNTDIKKPFEILNEDDVLRRVGATPRAIFNDPQYLLNELEYIDKIQWKPQPQWMAVTEELDVRAKHGQDWVVIGSVMHRLFDAISRGTIGLEEIPHMAETILKEEVFGGENLQKLHKIIIEDIEKLKASNIMQDIIMPKENSYSELPFCLEKDNFVFKGRIDRLIIKDRTALIYDYKTFPIKEREKPELIEKYRYQIDIYKEAVEELFKITAEAYLVFTHLPEVLAL